MNFRALFKIYIEIYCISIKDLNVKKKYKSIKKEFIQKLI